MASQVKEKYFLLTQGEITEIKAAIEFAMEVGYSDLVAKLAEDAGAIYAIDAVIGVAEREQGERNQIKKEV